MAPLPAAPAPLAPQPSGPAPPDREACPASAAAWTYPPSRTNASAGGLSGTGRQRRGPTDGGRLSRRPRGWRAAAAAGALRGDPPHRGEGQHKLAEEQGECRTTQGEGGGTTHGSGRTTMPARAEKLTQGERRTVQKGGTTTESEVRTTPRGGELDSAGRGFTAASYVSCPQGRGDGEGRWRESSAACIGQQRPRPTTIHCAQTTAWEGGHGRPAPPLHSPPDGAPFGSRGCIPLPKGRPTS